MLKVLRIHVIKIGESLSVFQTTKKIFWHSHLNIFYREDDKICCPCQFKEILYAKAEFEIVSCQMLILVKNAA